MNTGSLNLGNWLGIRVQMHWSVGLIALLLGASLGQAIGWLAGGIGVIAFLGSILAHEFAHALTARRFDVGTESIQLWALGGVARLDREAPTAKAEGWIAAAGPLASFAVGAAAIGGWYLLDGRAGLEEFAALLGWLGVINAFLAIFNLLPGSPLDGGRILKAVRWGIHGDRHQAATEAGRAGVVLGWIMIAGGAALLLQAQSGFWLLITGLFILANARVEITSARISGQMAGIKVRDITWFGLASAGSDMDADSMLWQRQRLGSAGGVTVTDETGVPQGVVLEEELWDIPSEQRPWVMLTQLMVPFDRTAKASPDDDLSSVLPRLNPMRPIVTVWEDDRLVGMVPPKQLKARLEAAGV